MITSAFEWLGTVSGPFPSDFSAQIASQKHIIKSAAPTPSLVVTSFRFMNEYLAGGEAVSTLVSVATCNYLVSVQVIVGFDGNIDPSFRRKSSDNYVEPVGGDDDESASSSSGDPSSIEESHKARIMHRDYCQALRMNVLICCRRD
jgi:hypothetical protein